MIEPHPYVSSGEAREEASTVSTFIFDVILVVEERSWWGCRILQPV